MIFAAPLVLLALVLLPVLWWLLRATPPAPREQSFPAIRLLAGLRPREETPARTPWWLLALRVAAAALLILGLARPILTSGQLSLAARGPILLAIDTDWSAGPDWPARLEAADAVLDLAARSGRDVRLLATAPDGSGVAQRLSAPTPAAVLRPRIAALRPMPWPRRGDEAAAAVEGAAPGPVFYVAGGAGTETDATLAARLTAIGPVTMLTDATPVPLLSAVISAGGLSARLRLSAGGPARRESVMAETGDGRVLGQAVLDLAAGATEASAPFDLPPELVNQLSALRLAGAPGAGSVALLDEAARRRPVGVVSNAAADTPLLGADFYVDRALAPTAELRHGTVAALLARPLSLLVVADQVLQGAEADAVEAWVKKGGMLVRFAGPALTDDAAEPDPLLPVTLLGGERRLGGAMSWEKPEPLAPFPPGSAFAGLAIPGEVTVQRQVLADPAASAAAQSWATLADGTPLVTAIRHGAGQIVLFHVTANADWSNLPLSGLFVDMLGRLVSRSAGVEAGDDRRLLHPLQTLDGAGVLGAPPPSARGVLASDLASPPSEVRPPGFYGTASDRRAVNLGALKALVPHAVVQGARVLTLDAAPRDTELGQPLVALGLLLLLADLLVTLALRGLLRAPVPVRAALVLVLCLAAQARAAEHENDSPALGTHLAYVATGDAEVDATSKAGLAGLSDYVNNRTAAVLAEPASVTPGRDDLSFYPLIYLPVTAGGTTSPAYVAALNDYMRHGGIVVIDLRGSGASGAGSGAGQAPDTQAALRRMAAGLDIPALAPLTSAHVLSRSFYLLTDYPGRYDGDTVWVQQAQDRSNDSVSPVIIGSNDWAAAWAQDEDGKPLFAVIPGGQRQRTLAFRFGVNLVMYALTGNYKGDQVHVPAILERLGQ